MKLSKNTIGILKNFATINPTLLIQPGSVLKTITDKSSTIFAMADVVETFPVEAGIYDVPQLLNVLSLFTDPDIEFGERYLTISEDDFEVKYEYCAANLITAPPGNIRSLSMDGSFTLLRNDLNTLMRGASVMGLEDLFITEKDGLFNLSLSDGKNSSANQFSLGVSHDVVLNRKIEMYQVKVENLKMIPADYKVEVSSKAIRFERVGETLPLVYYVAVVPASTN